MFLFATFVSCLEPVILVPPMFGSELYGSIYDLYTHWYCNKNFEDEVIWVSDGYAIPPLFNCLAEWLTVEWNYTGGYPASRNKTKVYPYHFGTLDGIKYIDHGIFGHHFIPDLIYIVQRFEKDGYKEGVDLFGAPYDFRMMPMAMGDYFDKLKDLVEDVYKKTGKRVSLYGISGGGNTLHHFCELMTQEWKDKHIRSLLLHGPSFGGAGEALIVLWQQTVDWMPSMYMTDVMKKFYLSLPTIWAHLPNAPANTQPIIIGPDGHKYYGNDIPQLFVDHNRVTTNDNLNVLNMAKPWISRKLTPTGVPTYILFNSVLNTPYGMQFEDWEKPPTILNVTGDGTLSGESLYYLCNNWGKDPHPVICHDLKIDDNKYSHAGQMTQPDVVDIIFKVLKDDSWMVPGPHIVTGNHTLEWMTMHPK